MKRLLSVAAVLLTLGRPALAQEQTSSIAGVVRDALGAVVPGVAIAAESAGKPSIETVTNGNGTYKYAALRPGRYSVTARLDGFVTARVTDLDLTVGTELSLDLMLTPAGPNQTIEVTRDAPRIAITQATRNTSLRPDDIERMPRAKDFTALAVYVSGSNDERKLGGISIDGSSGAENRIVIDGMETTDTWNGTPGQTLPPDFLEELQVKSSGYSAEYGGSTGGVLNAITRSGGNAWRGEAMVYVSGDALDASSRPSLRLAPENPSRAEYVTYPEDAYSQVEPGFTIGGPILRDRLWMFAGYLPLFRPVDRTVAFRADGITRTMHQRLDRHATAVNTTLQIRGRWRARAAFSTGHQRQSGVLPERDGTSNPAADYSIDDVTPNYSVSAGADYMPGSRWFLSARAGYFYRDSYNEGVYQGDRYIYPTSSLGFPDVPQPYRQPRGFSNVPSNNARDRAKGPRLGIQVDATTTFTRGGQHQLKGGVQLDRLGIDVLGGATGNVTSVFWGLAFNGMQGRYGYYVLGSNDIIPNRGFLTRGAATVNNLGLFLQDAWSAGRRLTLHLGLRTENEHVPSLSPDPSIPPTAIHFGFADKLAPRLGAAWDATGDGRTKVYGSWGVFYDITKLQMTIGFGAFSNRVYHFTLDNGDLGTIVDNPDCPPACPGTLIAGPAGIGGAINDPARDLIDPDLDQMRLREGVVGVEREIGSTLTFRARYVRKHLDRTIEDVGTRRSAEAEPSIQIANPGYGRVTEFYPAGGTTPVATSNAIRDYDAVEVGMDRRLANRWSARVSYLWSRLHGNYSGLAASDEDGRVAPNTTGSFDYPLMTFDERGQPIAGPLGTDRTHQVKANVLVDLPWGTSAGLGWFAGTGIPRTRDAFYEPGVPVQYRGRESDGRLPFLSQVDLHLQHYVRIDRRLTLTVSMNAFNLLNQAEATNYHQSELFPGQRLPVDEARIFNGGIDTQALIAQHGVVRDARFLMNSGFQAPRTVTLGVKLGF